LFDSGAIPALLPVVDTTEDVETRRCIAFALNNIAANEANHKLASGLVFFDPWSSFLKTGTKTLICRQCLRFGSCV